MEADRTVPEVIWSLEVNDRPHVSGTALPSDLDTLAVGRLIADGFLSPGERPLELHAAKTEAGTIRWVARVEERRAAAARAEAAHRFEFGCGLRHFVDCAPIVVSASARLPVPADDEVGALLRMLFSKTTRPRGVHTIGLWDGERLVHVVEEVGRHAGVDKACGWASLRGEPMGRLGLVLTARISGEIAVKAARAGIAWVATRSIPTELAAEIAAAAGLPLIARAASRDPDRFVAVPERPVEPR